MEANRRLPYLAAAISMLIFFSQLMILLSDLFLDEYHSKTGLDLDNKSGFYEKG